MAFAPVFQRPFSATFDRRAAAAAVPWWLSGGVAAANAVAVYQPKGAASLAASYVNLANPGTYDAAPGVAPTFDADGWAFAGGYLLTGVVPDANTSILVRYSQGSATGFVIGSRTSAPLFEMAGSWSGFASVITYGRNTQTYISPPLLSGVIGIVGGNAYREGVLDGALAAWSGTGGQIAIGARNNGSSPFFGTVQAVAIYNTTLTAPQVAAISAAMAAL